MVEACVCGAANPSRPCAKTSPPNSNRSPKVYFNRNPPYGKLRYWICGTMVSPAPPSRSQCPKFFCSQRGSLYQTLPTRRHSHSRALQPVLEFDSPHRQRFLDRSSGILAAGPLEVAALGRGFECECSSVAASLTAIVPDVRCTLTWQGHCIINRLVES